jgi:uncharacterized repeat protein (TIGR02543 family)
MDITIKSKFSLRSSSYRKSLVLLTLMLLVSSLCIGVFAGYAEGQNTTYVRTETELKNAVSNAGTSTPAVIVLNGNIALTSVLSIPANKDITLQSNSTTDFFKLFGAYDANTITVENGGILRLAGIGVTHVSGTGTGVIINSGGKLFMSDGEIFGNTESPYYYGGGVHNGGNFTLSGGKIHSNSGWYGAVYNSGGCVFTMSGGTISSNTGVGVYNLGNVTMLAGMISNNNGGGVANGNNFVMSGGEISGNTAVNGAGVSSSGTFIMTGGKISNNNATNPSWSSTASGGGGVYTSATFVMSGGEISGNYANTFYSVNGGGVLNHGNFNMTGGTISNNKATNGGGVYLANGYVWLSDNSKISGNTATSGGGVWVALENLGRLYVFTGVVFSDNRASLVYERAPEHADLYDAYVKSNVWTAPFTQGYNNYDISYTYGKSTSRFTVTVQGSYATPSGAGTYSAGDTVTLNTGTRSDYTFSGWTVNEGGVTLSYGSIITATFIMPAGNVVVTASWTAIANGGSGGGSGGGNSGGSDSFIDSGGSSGSSSSSGGSGGWDDSSNNSDNNTPFDGSDGSYDSGYDEQYEKDNGLLTISILQIVIIAVMMIVLVILIITTVANKISSKVAEINLNPNYIEKNRGALVQRFFFLLTAGYYAVYVERVGVEKINIMIRRQREKDANVADLSFSATYFAILWTIFLSPAILFVCFAFVNGILLNTAAHTAIFNLDFTAFTATFIEQGIDGFQIVYSIINDSSITFLGATILYLLFDLFVLFSLSSYVKNGTTTLVELADSYGLNIKKRYAHVKGGIFGDTERVKINSEVFEKLRDIHNSSTG